MRILHIITPKRFSGGELCCFQICEESIGRGHEVLIATKRCRPVLAALQKRRIPYVVAPVASKFNFAAPLVIRRLARRWKADVIHTHHSTAALWGSYGAWLAGIPCVSHVHAVNTSIWLLSATHIIAVAEAVKEHLIRQGRPRDRISVVYNAVEVDGLPEVDRSAVLAGLGLGPDTLLIAVAAHLSKKKGHSVLLEALRKLRGRFPNLHCLVMGEGPERRALEALRGELGLGEMVSFTGYRADAKDIMAVADMVVLPSITGEGLPLALLEAAARARPMVATRLAGVPELVIDGETGFTVAPGDPGEFSDRLSMLLADPELRERMGSAARELAIRRHTRDVRITAIEQAYARALETKRGGG